MRVVAIGLEPGERQPVLLLQEISGRLRVLPVWVGMAEATVIEFERRHAPAPRPLTHHLISEVIDSCGRRMERVCLTMLRDNVFHAELVISPDIRISARASDAVALALHLGAPIHAADSVLDQAGVDVELIGIDSGGEADASPPVGPEEQAAELERFRRFLDDTTPDDFDTT